MPEAPWRWQHGPSGWTLESRFIARAGQLEAAGTTSLGATLVLVLAVSSPQGVLSVDAGPGLACFMHHEFGIQHFGRAAQIIGTTGIGLDPFAMCSAGSSVLHVSDAGLDSSTSLGADLPIVELGSLF